MRILPLMALGSIGLYATLPTSISDARLIDRLDNFIQQRFAAPLPDQLGMSRIAGRPSFGAHFQPMSRAATDFQPMAPGEQAVVSELESAKIQVGLYVFGAAITHSPAGRMDFRALKGPAAITKGTPRPAWYPPLALQPSSPDALPDWNAIYSLAADAMKKFDAGGKEFRASLGTWHIQAKPVPASAATCLGCHNNPAIGRSTTVLKLNQPVGGVIYAFRRAL